MRDECGIVRGLQRLEVMLAVGDEDAEDAEQVAVYCPECAARELGGP